MGRGLPSVGSNVLNYQPRKSSRPAKILAVASQAGLGPRAQRARQAARLLGGGPRRLRRGRWGCPPPPPPARGARVGWLLPSACSPEGCARTGGASQPGRGSDSRPQDLRQPRSENSDRSCGAASTSGPQALTICGPNPSSQGPYWVAGEARAVDSRPSTADVGLRALREEGASGSDMLVGLGQSPASRESRYPGHCFAMFRTLGNHGTNRQLRGVVGW